MNELILFLPEIVLAVTVFGLFLAEATYHGESGRFLLWITWAGIGTAIIQSVILFSSEPTMALQGGAYLDGLVFLTRVLVLLSAGLVVGISSFSKEVPKDIRAEQFAFILLGALAAQAVSLSGNLLLVLCGIMFLHLVSTLLIGFRRESTLSSEAAVKSYFFNIVSCVFFAIGTLIFYSQFKTFDFRELTSLIRLAEAEKQIPVSIGTMMIFASMAIPLAIFPFHLWLPDAMQGAPAPTGAYLALIPRIAAIAAMVRMFGSVFSSAWVPWMGVVLAVSMLVNALSTVTEKSAKRLFAGFTSIDSAALLLGVLSLQQLGWRAMFFQLLVTVIASSGAFFVLTHFINESGTDDLEELKPRLQKSTPELVYLILFLAFWATIPPMPGFFGKFVLWGEMIHQGHSGVALAAFFAFIMLGVALFRKTYLLFNAPPTSTTTIPRLQKTALWGLAFALGVPVAVFCFFSDWVFGWVEASILKILA